MRMESPNSWVLSSCATKKHKRQKRLVCASCAFVAKVLLRHLPARDADFPLHESLDFEWDTFSLCGPNEFTVDLEDPQLHEIFDLNRSQPLVAHLCHKLRRHFENLHLYEGLKRFLIETHLTHLAHKLRIDFEDASFDQFFHAEILKSARLHLTHEL